MTAELIKSVIQRIAVGPERGRDVSTDDARSVMQAVLAGQVDPVQTAVILIALRMKRESIDEFSGMLDALQAELAMVQAPVAELICLADPFDGYQRCLPMTPFLPAVLAACGSPAALTGVEAIGPKFGITSHQVYASAGIATNLTAAQAAASVGTAGWAYVGQEQCLPKLFALRPLREQIVKRTAITTLERLLHPLRGWERTHLVLGYVHKAYPEIYTAVAKRAGFSSSLLTKGVEGGLAPALNKPLRQHIRRSSQPISETQFKRRDLPLDLAAESAAHMVGKGQKVTAEATFKLGISVLQGAPGVARKSLVLAAAQVIDVYQLEPSLEQAVEKVQNCLDNGSALERFNALREAS